MANAIDANTAMQFNQYVYQSRLEERPGLSRKLARDKTPVREECRGRPGPAEGQPDEVDIARGDALNVALDELSDPKVFAKAVYTASKKKVGGETIRDIPFQYASAAISVSVHQLTQGGRPAALKNNAAFATDRTALRAIAAELRKEGDETGTLKPETIQKAKDQILATKAKIEATFARNSPDRVAADKYIKALYGFVKMLETPAVNVLLAGVEKHPDASLGDLMQFMANFNLRFGAAQTPRQKEVYRVLYPMLVQVRNEIVPVPGSTTDPRPPTPNTRRRSRRSTR